MASVMSICEMFLVAWQFTFSTNRGHPILKNAFKVVVMKYIYKKAALLFPDRGGQHVPTFNTEVKFRTACYYTTLINAAMFILKLCINICIFYVKYIKKCNLTYCHMQ